MKVILSIGIENGLVVANICDGVKRVVAFEFRLVLDIIFVINNLRKRFDQCLIEISNGFCSRYFGLTNISIPPALVR